MKKWQILGEFYGYPKCCIQEFIDRAFKIRPTKLQLQLANGTGFIPCKKCAERLNNEGLKIDSLIKNRKCEIEFPHGDSILNQQSQIINPKIITT